ARGHREYGFRGAESEEDRAEAGYPPGTTRVRPGMVLTLQAADPVLAARWGLVPFRRRWRRRKGTKEWH
ncbi:MAG: hypothetical protein ACRD0C_21965, partial [Acidimicrobiia bacterium]